MEGGGGGRGSLSSSSCLMTTYEPHNNNSSSHNNSNNNNNIGVNVGSAVLCLPPSAVVTYNNNNLIFSHQDHHHHQQNNNTSMMLQDNIDDHGGSGGGGGGLGFMMNSSSNNSSSSSSFSSFKAKIMSHPHYPRLLSAYLNCQKIGAPPEVVERLEEACRASVVAAMSTRSTTTSAAAAGDGGVMMILGQDPALDQFMEAYCEMLIKYEQELSKPFKEAMLFLSRIESQFKSISISSSEDHSQPAAAGGGEGGGGMEKNGGSSEGEEDEVDVNNNMNPHHLIDPQAEDRELKGQLLRKYSGYLGSLKQEFMKKRKKGKLPKEARQQLLDWWARHYKWPYPSEAQKLALAESTGLDQKQINNWFINQRKRHWKPSEDMQFVVMDHAAAHPHYFMENILGNPYPMDVSLL